MKKQKLKVGDKISYTKAAILGQKTKRIVASIAEITNEKIVLDNGDTFIIVNP